MTYYFGKKNYEINDAIPCPMNKIIRTDNAIGAQNIFNNFKIDTLNNIVLL